MAVNPCLLIHLNFINLRVTIKKMRINNSSVDQSILIDIYTFNLTQLIL